MHTPGPWRWWTSNSWRRLKRDDRGVTQNVLEPYVCRDGHPDVTISEDDMGLIEAAPELLHALEAAIETFGKPHREAWLNDTAFAHACVVYDAMVRAALRAKTPAIR